MTEKPLIFSTPMVRALLDGSKSMTRRLVNPQPFHGEIEDGILIDEGKVYSPPHPVGSLIYAKETWQTDPAGKWGECYHATGHSPLCKLQDHLWRPSIFMPKWAARIWLEVTAVKVERLGSITDDDAISEGAFSHAQLRKDGQAINLFIGLWNSIHGPGSWDRDKDKWVWAYSLKRIKT